MDKEYTDLGSSADYLAWLEHAVEERDEAERRMAKCVRGARAQGASWAAIGRKLGVSKQAAQKKYGNVACSCGCGGTDADCTTPVPEGPARELTDAEEEREQLGEWAMTRDEFGTTPVALDVDQDEELGPETRIFCPFCMANIGKNAKGVAIELFRGEHAQFGSGEDATCAEWLRKGLTKPYYLPTDRPWQSGWKLPADRKASFGK